MTGRQKRNLIILTDPGQDQAAAIFMILGAPEAFNVKGIVATAGNIDLSYTVTNCLKLLELADRTDIPVYSGSPRPIVRRTDDSGACPRADRIGRCRTA